MAKDVNEQPAKPAKAAAPTKVWIVVQSKVGQEKVAAAALRAQGFEIYLPLQLIERARQGRRDTISIPFLPRYMFAHVTLKVDHWKAMFQTQGVHTVLGGTRPIGVKDHLIERIRHQEDGGFLRMGLAEESGSERTFMKGKPVKVDMGTCDIEGLFLEPVDGKRAMVLVSLLQRDSRITVDLWKLKDQATSA